MFITIQSTIITNDRLQGVIKLSIDRQTITICLFLITGTLGCSDHPEMFEPGFPADFPKIEDTGGLGKGEVIGGFGGIRNKKEGDNRTLRQINREALKHRPVILLHGNGVNALHDPAWYKLIPAMGMNRIGQQLRRMGYSDAEIWAPSYLGSSTFWPQLKRPVRDNLPDVRRFIDAVIDYLEVEKVDIIAHSLGNNMAIGYLKGFQSDNSWDNDQHRLKQVGTYVSLAAGHYGLRTEGDESYERGSVFESGSHRFNGVMDDTPCGAVLVSKMIADDPSWMKSSSLDGAEICDRIYYVAIRAIRDLVEAQNEHTGRLVGADLNRGYYLHSRCPICKLRRHASVLSDQRIFNDYFPYLNRYPP